MHWCCSLLCTCAVLERASLDLLRYGMLAEFQFTIESLTADIPALGGNETKQLERKTPAIASTVAEGSTSVKRRNSIMSVASGTADNNTLMAHGIKVDPEADLRGKSPMHSPKAGERPSSPQQPALLTARSSANPKRSTLTKVHDLHSPHSGRGGSSARKYDDSDELDRLSDVSVTSAIGFDKPFAEHFLDSIAAIMSNMAACEAVVPHLLNNDMLVPVLKLTQYTRTRSVQYSATTTLAVLSRRTDSHEALLACKILLYIYPLFKVSYLETRTAAVQTIANLAASASLHFRILNHYNVLPQLVSFLRETDPECALHGARIFAEFSENTNLSHRLCRADVVAALFEMAFKQSQDDLALVLRRNNRDRRGNQLSARSHRSTTHSTTSLDNKTGTGVGTATAAQVESCEEFRDQAALYAIYALANISANVHSHEFFRCELNTEGLPCILNKLSCDDDDTKQYIATLIGNLGTNPELRPLLDTWLIANRILPLLNSPATMRSAIDLIQRMVNDSTRDTLSDVTLHVFLNLALTVEEVRETSLCKVVEHDHQHTVSNIYI